MLDKMEAEQIIPTPIAMGNLSKEQLDIELQKGIDSLKNGKGLTTDEVDEILNKDFNI